MESSSDFESYAIGVLLMCAPFLGDLFWRVAPGAMPATGPAFGAVERENRRMIIDAGPLLGQCHALMIGHQSSPPQSLITIATDRARSSTGHHQPSPSYSSTVPAGHTGQHGFTASLLARVPRRQRVRGWRGPEPWQCGRGVR